MRKSPKKPYFSLIQEKQHHLTFLQSYVQEEDEDGLEIYLSKHRSTIEPSVLKDFLQQMMESYVRNGSKNIFRMIFIILPHVPSERIKEVQKTFCQKSKSEVRKQELCGEITYFLKHHGGKKRTRKQLEEELEHLPQYKYNEELMYPVMKKMNRGKGGKQFEKQNKKILKNPHIKTENEILME